MCDKKMKIGLKVICLDCLKEWRGDENSIPETWDLDFLKLCKDNWKKIELIDR